MKLITKIALAMFVSALIIYESDSIPPMVDVALKAFGKEAAKINKPPQRAKGVIYSP